MARRMVATGMWVGTCIGALCACGGNSTGPGFPPIQGNYATTFAFTFNNAANSQQNGTFQIQGTMTIDRPASDGSFTGSYEFTNANGSGDIEGQIDDQGTVVINEFGDSGAPPMVEVGFLQAQWSNCDFSAVSPGGMSGTLAANTLTLTGTLGFNCDYTNGSGTQSFPTTLTEQVAGSK